MVKQKTKSLISSFMLVLLLLVSILSIFNNTITAKAGFRATSDSWQGNEDATDVNQFGGSVTTQNAYKMWSAFKELGMTDAQVCGAMGNIDAECGFFPETVEGCYDRNDNVQSVEAYILRWSSQLNGSNEEEVNKTSTKLTDDIMRSQYKVDQYYIDEAHAGRGQKGVPCPGAPGVGGLDFTVYYAGGVGRLGIGIYQFTGDENKELLMWAGQNNVPWYNMDNQLVFVMRLHSLGGYSKGGEKLLEYMEATKGFADDPRACAQYYCDKVIVATDKSSFSKRQDSADSYYQALKGKGWDKKYGKSIIDGSGLSGSVTRVKTHEGIQDYGIVETLLNPVLRYPLNDGFLFGEDNRDEINKTVWLDYINALDTDSDSGGDVAYSLFELYGEDVNWYYYYGESTYVPKTMDHLWSAQVQNETDIGLSDTLFYNAYNYLSCRVYPDRPTVLEQEDLYNGLTDPRANREGVHVIDGYLYVDGTLKLSIAKVIVSIVAVLMGPELRQAIYNAVNDLETSTFWQAIHIPILVIVAIGMAIFIVTFAIKAIKYAGGKISPRELLKRFGLGILSLGLIFTVLASPTAFNTIVDKTLNLVDDIFNDVIAMELQGDEVVAVQDTSKASHAAIWKIAIFKPWVRGQFGRDYDELYTNYETNLDSGKSAMPQSNETESSSPLTDEPFFNSTKLTGDVYAYRGNGKYVRNWAAYLYSVGTVYHIDSTLTKEDGDMLKESITFPNFTQKTTGGNTKIHADTFRILDAQMNISPQYYRGGEVINNYTDSNELDPSYWSQSSIMLINCLLLVPMFPVIFQKLLAFLNLLITLIKLMYFSILEIYKENSGLREIFPDVKKHFFNYCLASAKLMILITLYYALVDKGILLMIVYLLASWAILNFSIKDAKQFGRNIKQNIKMVKNKLSKK